MYVWVLYSTSVTERINEVVLYPFHAVEHGDETNLAGLLSFPYYGLASKSVWSRSRSGAKGGHKTLKNVRQLELNQFQKNYISPICSCTALHRVTRNSQLLSHVLAKCNVSQEAMGNFPSSGLKFESMFQSIRNSSHFQLLHRTWAWSTRSPTRTLWTWRAPWKECIRNRRSNFRGALGK